MLGRTLNLGILAHVDAGKTTLTERLLYAAGVISTPGSVDHGTTQTDTLDLERQRGITIRAAVATFRVADVAVNLIDTPGHPDFIAEVERSLSVLDGAVLVVSAVEGVQAQTLVLMRALRRLRIPALIFVNKCDRAGADPERVLGQIHARLVSSAIPMWAVDAAQLAEHDDALLAAYVDGAAIDVRRSLAALSRAGAVHPVFAGSAITGAGVESLLAGIAELLPAASPAGGPLAASVFKIERAAGGEKVAYVRVFSGAIRVRDRFGEEKVTAAEVFEPGGPKRAASIGAGQIGKVRGLRSIRVGDRLGGAAGLRRGTQFAPPTLQSAVDPLDPDEGQALRVALDQLAEQDPLIAVRQDGEQLSVSIYGEVQKEVLEATLRHDYGLAVAFRETRPIHVERPCGLAEATVLLNAPGNPFHAQLGLRVEPGEGVDVRFEIADHSRVPLYVYKRREEFEAAMDAYVRDALRHGLHGWEVIDCRVTVFDCWYSLADGPPSRRGPMPTAGDFRGLTPRVLRQALEHAGTVVCEPIDRVRIELPADALGATMAAASRLGADVEAPSVDGASASVEGVLPSVRVAELRRQLPSLTRGEGVAESSFAGYRPAVSAVPG